MGNIKETIEGDLVNKFLVAFWVIGVPFFAVINWQVALGSGALITGFVMALKLFGFSLSTEEDDDVEVREYVERPAAATPYVREVTYEERHPRTKAFHDQFQSNQNAQTFERGVPRHEQRNVNRTRTEHDQRNVNRSEHDQPERNRSERVQPRTYGPPPVSRAPEPINDQDDQFDDGLFDDDDDDLSDLFNDQDDQPPVQNRKKKDR